MLFVHPSPLLHACNFCACLLSTVCQYEELERSSKGDPVSKWESVRVSKPDVPGRVAYRLWTP